MRFIYNDGGRAAAGFKGEAGDCVARAIAIASGRPYREIYKRCAEINANYSGRSKKATKMKGVRSARHGVWTQAAAFKAYMIELGFRWQVCMKIGTGCKVHMREDELPAGRVIVSLSRHYAAVIDGILHDTYDCSRDGTRCVYGYWYLPS